MNLKQNLLEFFDKSEFDVVYVVDITFDMRILPKNEKKINEQFNKFVQNKRRYFTKITN